MKQFYEETTEYLINHLLIDGKHLRDVSFLHRNLGHSEHGVQAIRTPAIMMSQEEVALITDEWNLYIAGAVDTDDTHCEEERIDHYWGKCLPREILPFYSSEACQKSSYPSSW